MLGGWVVETGTTGTRGPPPREKMWICDCDDGDVFRRCSNDGRNVQWRAGEVHMKAV